MSTTTFMELELPTPTETTGPEWANQVNEAFDVVDEHDHSSGKGVKIKPAGIEINTELDFENNRATNVASVKLQDLDASLSGAANADSVQAVEGDLWFTNGSGAAVQITSGGALVSVPGSTDSFELTAVSSSLTISPSDTFVIIYVNTAATRTITLPAASAVGAGRVFIIKDITGQSETNNITVECDGSDTLDGAASMTIDSNYASIMVSSDGTSKWGIL